MPRSVAIPVVTSLAAASLLLATVGGVLTGNTGNRGDILLGPDDLCLGCICEATTNCNLTFGCSRGLCGPFLISEPYWRDAGEPTLNGDAPNRVGAYLRCVRDPYCAAATVRQYMNRFAQDCNTNGHVECDDFARIHYLGGYQCSLPMESFLYYQVFRQCLNSVQQLSGLANGLLNG